MMRATLWKLHQWLGLVTCVGVLLWGLSGVMHPIMSRLQPKPAQFTPPPSMIDLADAPPLARVLAAHDIRIIEQAGLARLSGVSAWRIALPGDPQARYFSTARGEAIDEGDRVYAEQLARHYTGLPETPIRQSRLITAFDNDYPAVNRLLPVWRVDFDRGDGLRAYIDTEQARLATLSDHTRGVLSPLFRTLHTWTFLEHTPRLRVAVMSAVLVCVLFSAGTGIYFYLLMRASVARRLKAAPLQRWHRALGAAVSLAALTAGVSGAYHLLHGERAQATPQARAQFAAQSLPAQSVLPQKLSRLSLGLVGDRVVWRVVLPMSASADPAPKAQVASGEHAHHAPPPAPASVGVALIDAHGLPIAGGEATLARALAARHAGRPEADIVSVEKITRFAGEYGFVWKRLPVYRVEFSGADHPRYYVEPATGALATRVDDWDALEGKSFAWLHKWHFTDAGKDVRDFLLALFAFGNVGVAVLGLRLFIRRRQPALPRTAAFAERPANG